MLTALIAAAGALVAVIALGVVLSAARKFNALNDSHWQLRYEFARLRARVAKLDGGAAEAAEADDTAKGA